MEGDEAIFRGRDLEIRDGIKALDDLRGTVTGRALLIQAPSGAGKSSFLRAGLWRRLRRHPGFTPLAIVRTDGGAMHHAAWGFLAGLSETLKRNEELGRSLALSPAALAQKAAATLPALLKEFADADAIEGRRRTLLLGIDQAEEMTALSSGDDAELKELLDAVLGLPPDLDLRLVLTVRDDSIDATVDRLVKAGLSLEAVQVWRLNRLPPNRFDDIIREVADAANRAGWPLKIDPTLVDALATAAAEGAVGESGDALPILALALQRLVQRHRAPGSGQVTLADQTAKEFLENAVRDAAREACEAAGAQEEDLRRLIIPRLATWDPRAGAEGAAKRQVAKAVDLFTGERAGLEALADALVAQRLFTRTGNAYEVAHEALLRVPPLGDLIFARREKFEQVRILEVEAREWADSGRSSGNLVRFGERLKEALALMEEPDFGPDLRSKKQGKAEGSPANVAEYLEACRAYEVRQQRDKQRNQRRVITILSVLTFVSLAFSALALLGLEKSLQARDAARVTDGNSALAKADNALKRYPDQILHRARAIGFSGFGGGDYQERTFVTFWAEAYRLLRGPEDRFPVLLPDRAVEIRQALAAQPAFLPFWRSDAFGSPVTGLAFAENDRFLRTKFADGIVRQWDLRKPEAAPVEVTGETADAEVTTGALLEGNIVKFHAYGSQSVELTAHPADATAWALDTNRKRLAVGLKDGSVVGWDVSGSPLGEGTNLLEIVQRGWFDFDQAQDVVAWARMEADLLASRWEEASPLPFAPKTQKPFRNSLNMALLPVAPGEFLMGSPADEEDRSDEETQHRVRLTHPFWLGQYEVIQGEWTALMGENPSSRKDPLAPVTDVSWLKATEFCVKLTAREREAGLLPKDWTYALPTEAQWEYACRAGTTTPFSFGKVLDGSQANCDGKFPYGTTVNGPSLGQTVAVGQYPANPWGFHDMHGNVYEWCRDWHGYYEFKEGEVSPDPNGRASGDYRVHCGGSWNDYARDCRSAHRYGGAPDNADLDLGFRLAAVPISSIPPEASSPGTASGR